LVEQKPRLEHLLNMFETRVAAARRVARLVAGIILLGGAASLALWGISGHGDQQQPALLLLAGTWAVAAIAYATVRFVVTATYPEHEVARAFPMRFEFLSLAVPAVGIALLTPLTLHLPVALYAGGRAGFEWWAWLSIRLVGVAHLALGLLVAIRAHQLAHGRRPMGWQRIAGICTIVASVPWIILFPVPILVGLTAIAMAPLALVMERVAARDRAEREALQTWVPTAIVVKHGRAAA
jgi:hypothetical protein